MELALQYVPRPWRLAAGVSGAELPRIERLHAAPPPGTDRGFVTIQGHGEQERGFWHRQRLRALEMTGAHAGFGPRTFAPLTATEHLFLANGRWVFGRADEARPLYDTAVRLGEDAWALDEQRVAEGLPSQWPNATDNTFERWAAVDARLYRGLFRWERGDRGGGMEDLRRAVRLAPDRIVRTLKMLALEPTQRPVEAEALREMWLEANGRPEGEKLDKLVVETANGMQVDELIPVLYGPLGYALVRELVAAKVAPESALGKAGARDGDLVLEYGGRKIGTLVQIHNARVDAEMAQAASVPVVLGRGNARIDTSARPDLQGVEWKEQARLDKK